MPPFWLVERVAGMTGVNMAMTSVGVEQVVHIAVVKVPVMVNSSALDAGERLLIAVEARGGGKVKTTTPSWKGAKVEHSKAPA